MTRYFGGTLLGPGGLVRAYTAATQAAVAAAQEPGQIVEMTSVVSVDVHVAIRSMTRCFVWRRIRVPRFRIPITRMP